MKKTPPSQMHACEFWGITAYSEGFHYASEKLEVS